MFQCGIENMSSPARSTKKKKVDNSTKPVKEQKQKKWTSSKATQMIEDEEEKMYRKASFLASSVLSQLDGNIRLYDLNSESQHTSVCI